MRYIGPFFRMNSLSEKEINGQLFYLSKEAVKSIVLNSRCGLVSQIKKYNKTSSSSDITTNSNFSPLLCVYRKASPTFIHSKNSNGFDEDSFKKEINPATNALMSLCLLELEDYYRKFKDIDNTIFSINTLYKSLSKDQLDFYSKNLRNREGVFVDKKNVLENNLKNFSLVDKDKKFKFSDQSFMMIAYYLYSIKNPDDDISHSYKEFSLQILKMFCDFKDEIYNCSLDEICKVILSLNIFYDYNNNSDAIDLIADLTDYIIGKFDEKDYYIDSLDTTCLFCIVLTLSYKHTKIMIFSEKSTEVINRLYTLYDEDKGSFYKLSSKKEIKYSCFDITFYILAFIVYQNNILFSNEYKILISTLYKKFIINSGLITSWPDAPTLDDYERYRGLSLKSADMVEETYFRMPNIPSPTNTGIAPIFNKSINYNKRKDSFSNEYKILISTLYKKFIINSGLITSWPDAPTLDDYERYRGLSLKSADMVEETYFRMPNIPSPTNTGIAPIFNKSINYNKRKDSFSNSKATFDSYKNFFNFFLYIYLFKEEYMKELNLIESNTSITSNMPNSDNNDSNELNTDSISNTTKEDENSSTKPNSISNNDNTSNTSPLIEDIEAILFETKNDLNETNNSTDIL